jgi:hypothetical protein
MQHCAYIRTEAKCKALEAIVTRREGEIPSAASARKAF